MSVVISSYQMKAPGLLDMRAPRGSVNGFAEELYEVALQVGDAFEQRCRIALRFRQHEAALQYGLGVNGQAAGGDGFARRMAFDGGLELALELDHMRVDRLAA